MSATVFVLMLSLCTCISCSLSAQVSHALSLHRYRTWINRVLADDGFQPVSADIALEKAFFSGEKLRELLECLTGIHVHISNKLHCLTEISMTNLAIR